MTHLYRKHIAATYLERSGEISPMCIRDAFPLQVGGTDSAVSPAHNECLTGACWKYKPGTSPTHNGQEWCRLGYFDSLNQLKSLKSYVPIGRFCKVQIMKRQYHTIYDQGNRR